MEPAFVTVLVEEHEALPQGCVMRFKRVGQPRAVARVMYEPEADARGAAVWRVEAIEEGGSVGQAWAVTVEDSSAGVSTLVYGGSWGLRLRREDEDGGGGGGEVAEAYLLLVEGAVLEG
jgi:hypothetical protein